MPKLKDLKSKIAPVHVLAYGEAGTGKTAFGLTGGEKVWCIDMDPGGTRTGIYFEDKWQVERLEAEVKLCQETDPFHPTAFDKASSYIDTFRKELPADILMIDSFTSFMESCLNKISAMNNRIGKNLRKNDWLMIIQMLEFEMKKIQAIPRVVYMTAHRMSFIEPGHEDDEHPPVKVAPLIYGTKLPGKVNSVFDEIWYFEVIQVQGGIDIKISSQPTTRNIGRSRGMFRTGLASEGIVALLEKTGQTFELSRSDSKEERKELSDGKQ